MDCTIVVVEAKAREATSGHATRTEQQAGAKQLAAMLRCGCSDCVHCADTKQQHKHSTRAQPARSRYTKHATGSMEAGP